MAQYHFPPVDLLNENQEKNVRNDPEYLSLYGTAVYVEPAE